MTQAHDDLHGISGFRQALKDRALEAVAEEILVKGQVLDVHEDLVLDEVAHGAASAAFRTPASFRVGRRLPGEALAPDGTFLA